MFTCVKNAHVLLFRRCIGARVTPSERQLEALLGLAADEAVKLLARQYPYIEVRQRGLVHTTGVVHGVVYLDVDERDMVDKASYTTEHIDICVGRTIMMRYRNDNEVFYKQ